VARSSRIITNISENHKYFKRKMIENSAIENFLKIEN